MKNLNELRIPKSLKKILAEESIWEEDAYAPFYLSVHDVTGEVLYEVYISPHAAGESRDGGWVAVDEIGLADINAELERAGFEVNGYGWEKAIFTYLAQKAPGFGEQVAGDSDTEACVLYTSTEADFRRLLALLWELVQHPQEISQLDIRL